MARSHPSVWSQLAFCLKWWLILFPATVAAFVALGKTAYPWTAVLTVIASFILFLFDYARRLDAIRPRGWRVGDSWPRKLWKVFAGLVVSVVIFAIFGEIIATVLLLVFAAVLIAAPVAFVAERFGWRPYGRLERYQPPLVEPRFQGSRPS